LIVFPDLEVVQCRDEVVHERIELAGRHAHVGVRLGHVAPRVGARSAGVVTQLVDEFLCQPVQVRPGEFLVDATIIGRASFKGAYDGRDGFGPAEPLI